MVIATLDSPDPSVQILGGEGGSNAANAVISKAVVIVAARGLFRRGKLLLKRIHPPVAGTGEGGRHFHF